MSERVVLTRHERRKAGIVLVGVRYAERGPIGRNTRVGGVKFKRTELYSEPRR